MCLINMPKFFNNKKELTHVSREDNLKKYLKNFWFLGQSDKKEATSNYLKFIANGIQCELNLNYYDNNFTYQNLAKYIRYSFLLDMESEDITYKRKIDISDTPVISMVWKDSLGECISDIGKCNDNPFSIARVDSNVNEWDYD